MKSWKLFLFIAAVVVTVLGSAVFFSCERNPCNGLVCAHGGACGNGLCTCPVGWYGPTCVIRTVQLFLGTYAGETKCDEGAPIWDSVFVLPDTLFNGSMAVKVIVHSNSVKDTLSGSVIYNSTAAIINVPEIVRGGFTETYTITLEYGNQLTVNMFTLDTTNPHLWVQDKCQFVGTRTLK